MGPEAARIARQQLGQSESSITLVKEQAFGGYAHRAGARGSTEPKRARVWGRSSVLPDLNQAGATLSCEER